MKMKMRVQDHAFGPFFQQKSFCTSMQFIFNSKINESIPLGGKINVQNVFLKVLVCKPPLV